MGPVLGIVAAVATVAATAVGAIASRGGKKSSGGQPTQQITDAEKPALTTPEASAERQRRAGAVGLTETSPLGLTGAPSTTNSKLLGGS